MKVKILVCYHKPAKLFKSDIFVPIHVGRAVAMDISKDGKISSSDLQWLLDNTIGDDTGDNISHLNRYFCELTGIYWAWKNYDKLGNPDFIGLAHYSRLFRFFKHFSKHYKKLKNEDFIKIFSEYDCVFPERHCWETLEQPFDYHQKIIKLSNSYYPELYSQYKKYKNRKDKYTFVCNMFILSKKDFFAYCETIFDILLTLHHKNGLLESTCYRNYVKCLRDDPKTKHLVEKISDNQLVPRIYGYISEILSSFIFENMIEKGSRPLVLPFENVMPKKHKLFNKTESHKGIKYKIGHFCVLYKKNVSGGWVYRLFGCIPFYYCKKRSVFDVWREKNKHNATYLGTMINYNTEQLDKIKVGNYTYGCLDVMLNPNFDAILHIGHYCSIGPNVLFIVSSEHPYKCLSTYPFKSRCCLENIESVGKGDIIIEDDVWIGANVIINSGVRICQGSIVASGAVVTKDVEPYSIVGGNPAKFIKYRFEQKVRNYLLSNLDWSKISKENCRQNIDILYKELTTKNVKDICDRLNDKK